jgi:hypothetical protein
VVERAELQVRWSPARRSGVSSTFRHSGTIGASRSFLLGPGEADTIEITESPARK